MKTLLLVAAATLAMGTAAQAADMGAPLYRPGKPMIEEFGSGWYLRGDVGHAGYQHGNVDRIANSVVNAVATDGGIDDSWVFGIGSGYKADWLRGDVTVDYRAAADIKGTLGGIGFDGNLSVMTVMLNGYVDLGTWSGITPYLGGGIGGAYVDVAQLRNSNGSNFGRGATWDFAWSLAAGVAVNLGPGFLVDFGYRYVNLGEPESGLLDSTTVPTRARIHDLAAHEVRVGVRYHLD